MIYVIHVYLLNNIDYQLFILLSYYILYSDQLVFICGMPSHFPTDWFVPDSRVGGTPDGWVGICVPALTVMLNLEETSTIHSHSQQLAIAKMVTSC